MRDCCVELAPISTDLGVWTDIVVALLAFGWAPTAPTRSTTAAGRLMCDER